MMPMTLTEPQYWVPFPWSTTKVQMSNDARKCVVFLGDCDVDGSPESFAPYATGFLIRRNPKSAYLVTVRHCANDLPFWVRMNTKRGAITMLVQDPDWVFHDDPTVDVAVMEFQPHPEAVWTPWYYGAVSEEAIAHSFAPGDLTYTVGLFRAHGGRAKNVPLVHTGHIAAFSEDEKVEVQDWEHPNDRRKRKLIDAYVVQCSAMPGASGSPVFIRAAEAIPSMYHVHDKSGNVDRLSIKHGIGGPPQAYGSVHLLGIWQGSWELPPEDDIANIGARLPAGYGVVVPGRKIFEIINMPKLKNSRDAENKASTEAKRMTQEVAVPDSIPRKVNRALFDKTLKKMLDTPPAPHNKKPA